jgi:hypothetical protein
VYAIYSATPSTATCNLAHDAISLTEGKARNRLNGHLVLRYVMMRNGTQPKSDDSARRTIPTSRQVKPWSPALIRYSQRAHHPVP